MLREVVPERWLDRATFVPVPPSKTIDHPDYDDRLLQVLQGLSQARRLDVRELVTMAESTDPAHLTQDPRDIRELMRRMRLEEALANPTPEAVIIFDDVLTTGAHFKAVQRILLARFPDVPMAGLFLARRAPEAGPI
jgi:predicted amidophosphoribosyltransferase